MRKYKRAVDEAVLFSFGAISYGLIEVIWRGHTHPSMLLAGGICFFGIRTIVKRFKNLNPLYKGLLCSAVITSVEFVFGVIFNIILKQNVWDYSGVPFNIAGQVCLLYSVIWALLSIITFPLCEKLNKLISQN